MHQQPDYATARRDAGFSWSVQGTYLAYFKLADVRLRDFFRKPEACVEAYRTGRFRARELFGDDIQYGSPSTPHISYAHVSAHGLPLVYPDEGEVAVVHACESLDDAIAMMRKPVDYGQADVIRFYTAFRDTMQKAFPDEPIGLGLGCEGPVTTAYLLRGDAFFYDLYDRPEDTCELLRLSADSAIAFYHYMAGLRKMPAVNPDSGFIADDIAAMIPPALWPEFVLPFTDRLFCGITTGRRNMHIEDLVAGHLPYLEALGLWSWDPSITPKLNPQTISAHCGIPFDWLLGPIHYPKLSSPSEAGDFLFQSAADGATSVITHLESNLCDAIGARSVRAFIDAGKEAKRLLDAGTPRTALANCVSPEGRLKFWRNW